MTIHSIQRNVISPVPHMSIMKDRPGEAEQLLEKWLPQLLNKGYNDRVDSYTDIAASGVVTNVLILPPSWGLWLCLVGIGKVNDAVNYQAAMVVLMDNTSGRSLVTWNAPNQVISLGGGGTIQSTQTSGFNQTMVGCAVQLLHYAST